MPSTVLRFAIALGIFGAVLGPAGPAAAAQPQPGQWRVVTKITMTGLPPGMPAGMAQQEQTQLQCVTPEQARDPKNWKEPDGGRGAQNCTTKRDWNGTVLTIESQCRGNPPTTVKGTMTFDTPTHYRGVMTSSSPTPGAPAVNITMEGQRIGECPR
jgi:uncharacterized protein DUF3617